MEGKWPDQTDDLSLDIHQTEDPDVFQADFDFGILEGVMIISMKADALAKYCSELDREAYSDDGSDEDQDDDDEDDDKAEYDKKPSKATKRKANAPKRRGRRAKKGKTGAAQSLVCMLRSRCRETREGMIYSNDEQGTIKFKDKNLANFTATAAFPCVGQNVKFNGRKISDVPAGSGNEWNDYSERAYEEERVGRWH